MARTDPQFNLRLPQNLKERIERAAANGSRSATAEIVRRLEESFAREDDALLPSLPERINAQIADLDEMFGRLEGRVARLKRAMLGARSGPKKSRGVR